MGFNVNNKRLDQIYFNGTVETLLHNIMHGYHHLGNDEIFKDNKDFSLIADKIRTIYSTLGTGILKEDVIEIMAKRSIEIKYMPKQGNGPYLPFSYDDLDFSQFEAVIRNCELIQKGCPREFFDEKMFLKEIRPTFRKAFNEFKNKNIFLTDNMIVKISEKRFLNFMNICKSNDNISAKQAIFCLPNFYKRLKMDVFCDEDFIAELNGSVNDICAKFKLDAIQQENEESSKVKKRRIGFGKP